jgi:hypothetical protein
VAKIGKMRNAYRIFMGKPVGKYQLGRWRRRWKDKTEMAGFGICAVVPSGYTTKELLGCLVA